MLHTPLCDLLSIDIPIVQAPIAPYTSPQLVAAVSNAGGLGSVGTALQSFDTVRRQVEQIRKLTNRPFAIKLQTEHLMKRYSASLLRRPNQKLFHTPWVIQVDLLNGLMVLEFFS